MVKALSEQNANVRRAGDEYSFRCAL